MPGVITTTEGSRTPVAGEQLGEKAHHHLAVLEHVRHPRGHAQVVLEHVELAPVGAHHVDPGDVRVDVAGDVDALHLGPVLRVAEDLLGRDDARAHDALPVVDVVKEAVQRLDALAQPRLERAPLRRRQDARDDVKGDEALGAPVVAVDGKGDADAVERQVGLGALRGERLRALRLEPGVEATVVRAHAAFRAHLVVDGGRLGLGHAHGAIMAKRRPSGVLVRHWRAQLRGMPQIGSRERNPGAA